MFGCFVDRVLRVGEGAGAEAVLVESLDFWFGDERWPPPSDYRTVGLARRSVSTGRRGYASAVDEILFEVRRDDEASVFVASWDDPAGGGITTQGVDLKELQENLQEAVAVHFDEGTGPRRIRVHFVTDPVLVAV